jgi:hypothetical protein
MGYELADNQGDLARLAANVDDWASIGDWDRYFVCDLSLPRNRRASAARRHRGRA